MHYLLYNPLANNYHACDDIHKILELHKEINYEQIDITKLDLVKFLSNGFGIDKKSSEELLK